MKYTSIFEKLLCLFNIISNSWIYISFSVVTAILIILLLFKKINKKTCFILVTLLTKIVLGYTIYIYYEDINNLITTIVDNIFLNIYFPSAYVYLVVLLLVNVIGVFSLFKQKLDKIYKIMNGTCIIIINFILALILEVISKNNIDVFAKESLFTNTVLVTLLELSINIFIIWIIGLMAVSLINLITEKIMYVRENKNLLNNPANIISNEIKIDLSSINKEYTNNNDRVIENPAMAFIPDNNYRFIPNFKIAINDLEKYYSEGNTNIANPENIVTPVPVTNYNIDNTFDLSAFIPKKQEVKPLTAISNNENNNIIEQIINNELPVIKNDITKEENEAKSEISKQDDIKNTYTLNDYRIFNKMLKDIREHNESNSIIIDKNLEYRLITKYSTETYNMFKTMLKIYSN